MRTVWKYQIDYFASTVLETKVPAGGTVLAVRRERVGSTQDYVSFWVEVDDDAPVGTRTFELFGTGMSIPDAAVYRGTAWADPLVLHLYEWVSA
jgi:hypothetical protein